jgi:hypothetical protein
MTFHKLLKISVLVLAVVVIGFVLLSVNANATENPITCTDDGTCATCHDQCQDGVICYGIACTGGGSTGGCIPCKAAKAQPMDFQKKTTQDDKVLLAQLMSKDPEVSQAMRSLR